jgi:hypothetical protein
MTIKTMPINGTRHYIDTDRPEAGAVPSVTSITGMLPKPFLNWWYAGMTAELAVDSLDVLPAMAARDRRGAVQYLKGAAKRYTDTRSDVGSRAHDLFERLITGQRVGRVHPDMEPYRRHFEEWLAEYQPELICAEGVAWSETHGYAGSFDALARVRGLVEIIDYKTSKDAYPDVALQLTAYQRSDLLIPHGGTPLPMPEINRGAVVHIKPERAVYKPVALDDEVFATFLALRQTWAWDKQISARVLGDVEWETGAIETGTERRS